MHRFTDIINEGVGLVSINKNTDERGSLCFAEWDDLPFKPERIFWIYDVKDGKSRGCHSHSDCEEVVFAVKGKFDLFIDTGQKQTTIHVDDPQTGVYIGKDVWCELKNFSSDAVCMVVASIKYMRDGYTNNYEDFKRLNRR